MSEIDENEVKPTKKVTVVSNSSISSEGSLDDSEESDDISDSDSEGSESEDSSFELDDVQIQPDDSAEVKHLKIKLLKEKSKVLDAKETIGSLVDQITAYKVSVEEDRLLLETQLKQEKKTKFELYEIYKEMESEKDNISKQLDIVILECEQLDKEKQTISKENINNLQTLMNEITTIEETNSHLEKELEKEKELHAQTLLNYQNQCQLVQKLEQYNKELSQFSNSTSTGGSGSNDQMVMQLKKQLLDAQALLTKEKEKLLNIDNLLFQARKIVGVAESNGGQLDQNSLFEITQLKSNVSDEKQAHHKTQLMLEEEKKKSELNKKTADNLVARMKELISSHHETLQLLDDERETTKGLAQEIQTMKEQFSKFPIGGVGQQAQQSTGSAPLTAGALNNLNSDNATPIIVTTNTATDGQDGSTSNASFEEGKLKQDPSIESLSSQSSSGQASNMMTDAYLSMKYGAKMYKTIRLKKNSGITSTTGISNKPNLANDLSMMFQPMAEKPTSPETNTNDSNNNNNNNNNNSISTNVGGKEVVFETNSFSSKNSLKFGGGVKFGAIENHPLNKEDSSNNTTNTNNGTIGANNKYISYSTSSTNLVGAATNSPSTDKKSSSKADKEKKEREKKLEKEKKIILKKIEKDLKKKEKENKDKKNSSSGGKSGSSSQTTPQTGNSNPETPKEPSPISSKSNSVSSLRDSFDPNTNSSVEFGGSLSSNNLNGGDRSPSMSGSLSVKEKRKSRFFS
ncbi:hypothetical protein DLAC_10642 [Tieghemostelium lacteum]|uniref:Uncharacterized protein n=1 Tax=Tieghemostelium lacteum TaxID=361077 RepID=A0A151Z4F5_TIELA|nr:hypothetical protein DLAC_10642 [Tieghemostelium lacteum]|eukprot:KYQ88840.1 hypothetical protein DLAC_10642 [Tieghemostelium lacteum]